MNSTFFIAKRYLFAKKSHNIINIISIISAVGIAIGCAALVIILSVYNGFDNLLRSFYDTETADLLISPAKGKTFDPSVTAPLKGEAYVESYQEILEENVYLLYEENNIVVKAKGVESDYGILNGLDKYIVDGDFSLQKEELNQIVLGRSIAAELRVNLKFLSFVEMYFPSRTGEVSIINPMGSLNTADFYPSGIISLDNDFDRQYVFVPIYALRELLEYTVEVSAVELKLTPECLNSKGVVKPQYQKRIASILGEDFLVKNRFQQNETVYKLLTYEKLAIYAILIFIMLIISCNIYSSMNMLVIEKKNDIEILKSMGADRRMIGRIFTLEGWMISLLGVITGIIVGLILCYLQIRFGLIKMPGNFIVNAYPVQVRLTDVLIVFASVSAIGFLMAKR
ncbi:MAG: ABC transporter permease [Bacteroidales bacterium]|nr:ABC transporter permease [Bacteroidales bacterium]